MNTTETKYYFDDRFGFLVLFVFISGFMGDIIIHIGTKIKFPFKKQWFAQGLVPYYKANGFLISGILGGLACVVALVFGQLILSIKENNFNHQGSNL